MTVLRRLLRPLTVPFALIVAVMAKLTRPLRRRQPPGSAVTYTDRGVRTAELVGLGSEVRLRQAALRARKVFASAQRKEELDRAHEIRTAEQVVETLGGMKGLVMKMGQMASYMAADVPEAWQQALAQLQADAPPMSPELAASVVTADLGAPPEQLFAEWDPVPVASASVGQVHRAITKDDRAVAVKIQYPGADSALTADLDGMTSMFKMMGRRAGAGRDLPDVDYAALLEEFRARILEEVDYVREADNQRIFAEHFRDHPFIRIPEVLPELSSRRVLTTELAPGARFAEASGWSQHERDLAGETIYRFVYRSIFRLGAFNGDPHPGNYLFEGEGRVTFLDFGLVKRVDARTRELLVRSVEVVRHDLGPGVFRQVLDELGFLKAGAGVPDQLVYDLIARPWADAMIDVSGPMPFPRQQQPDHKPTEEERQLLQALDLPPVMVILPRTLVGMQAVLARLGAEANWLRVADEVLAPAGGEATTSLGELEAAWLSGV